jgi:DNA replication protein DnaC
MKKLGSNAAEDLLEVFVRRHETASTLITTNRPTQDWGLFLGDVPAATAILDRFLAPATIVQITGKSYRLRQRATPSTTEAVDSDAHRCPRTRNSEKNTRYWVSVKSR